MMMYYFMFILLYFYISLARLRYNELQMIKYMNQAKEYYSLEQYQERMDFVISSLSHSSLFIYKQKRLIQLYHRLIRLYPIHPFIL